MRPMRTAALFALMSAAASVAAQDVPAEAPAAQSVPTAVVAPVTALPPGPLAGWNEAFARATLAEVKASAAEGLSPADYAPDKLEAALASGDQAAIAAAAEASWMALARDYAAGHTPEAARIGWKSPPPRSDAGWLRAKLAAGLEAGAPVEALKALLPTHFHYGLLKAALPTTTDKAARQRLRANLDRWRWMPRQMGERYLYANVPSYELDVVESEITVARHKIIVGAPKTPTPQFSAVATAVVINPSWYLPKSIVAESVGGLIQRSPAAARARGYRWTSGPDGLQVTQLPGKGNSLGTLKIEMPNPWAIYFHDTPAKQLFASDNLARSHGCMRTQGILGLALKLLADQPEWDAARIDATAATNETTRVPLTAQIPVHVAYFTVSPGKGGALREHADIYGRDAPVVAALGKE